MTSVPNADRIIWQLRRGTPGQGFGAKTQVDNGTIIGATGSLERDLRDFGPVLDGTRYLFRIRARQGSNSVTEFSQPVIFERDLSSTGMFTASAGSPLPRSPMIRSRSVSRQ